MKDYAIVFPGQGAQSIGMGLDFYNNYELAKRLFKEADEILNISISNICFLGSDEVLNDTINTQPAIFITSLVIFNVLQEYLGYPLEPLCLAGHSLGEYSALVASGSISFQDGLRLVRERGRLMKEAGKLAQGGMLVVIGADSTTLLDAIDEISKRNDVSLVLANDNCPGQVVLSGNNLAIEEFLKVSKSVGAKLTKRLPISVACHSPLMKHAQSEFEKSLSLIEIRDANFLICANTNATLLKTSNEIISELEQQLCGPVMWTDSIKRMIEEGVRSFIEIGPGQTLVGLIRRIDPNVNVFNVSSINDLSTLNSVVAQ